ncbi:MAG: hypothetical protein MJK11_14920 [Pseudomonadales bacterium]|nr:hypothetical protein [Pseudomonadales bacterium]
MRSIIKLSSAILSVSLLVGCGASPSASNETKQPETAKVKNIILMIGDGMGPQQVGLLLDFATHSKTDIYKNRTTALELFANGSCFI